MQTVRIGIIGIGNIGSAHLKTIASGEIHGMTVHAICDIDTKKLAHAAAQYPHLRTYSDATDLCHDPDLDAVLVAVPHPLHAEIGIHALQAGKHLLSEKPIDIRVSSAKRLLEVARRSNKQFGIMLNQRTCDLYQKMHRMVQDGSLGSLKRSVWIITNWYRTQRYYDSATWRATWRGEGGGVLLNQAPHNLDLWQWICGMPTAITAFCNIGKYHHIEVEDEATIYAEYENGATGVFITSTGDYPGTNRLEVSGTRGKMVLENGVLKFWQLRQDEREICETAATGFVTPETDYREFTSQNAGSHADILQNFADAILLGTPLLAPGYDGIYELTLSNAAYLSEWNGNQKLRLPLDTETFDAILAERQAHSTPGRAQPEEATLPPTARWQVRW